MNDKMKRAMEFLGKNWVLAKNSTYDPKRRIPGMCSTLRPIMEEATKKGRI